MLKGARRIAGGCMNVFEIRERIRDIWRALSSSDRWELFSELSPDVAAEVFIDLYPSDQAELLLGLEPARQTFLLKGLPPDDLADLLQEFNEADRMAFLAFLDTATRQEVEGLSAFHPDHAGGLMTPRFVTLKPESTIGEALGSVREQAKTVVETISVLYVVDDEERLLGILPLRNLLAGSDDESVSELMERDFLSVNLTMDREAVAKIFSASGFTSLPVLGENGALEGVITFDDIAEAVEDEVTEDIQKMGGLEAVDAPYLRAPLLTMIRKRAGWLSALFIGEMLTATAMSHYEDAIARAVVLAVFIPLIISSGGNSGSQASTLIIRAMALDEVRISDWWRVAGREVISGLCLGLILGAIGIVRILVWQHFLGTYGVHYLAVALTVGLSLVGVVLFGSLAGSMLPFLLRHLGFDPASASAPFVATLVDVTGLIIYFSVASVILSGAMV